MTILTFCAAAVLLLICVPLLIRYPITRESHAKVVEELNARRAAKHHEEAAQ